MVLHYKRNMLIMQKHSPFYEDDSKGILIHPKVIKRPWGVGATFILLIFRLFFLDAFFISQSCLLLV